MMKRLLSLVAVACLLPAYAGTLIIEEEPAAPKADAPAAGAAPATTSSAVAVTPVGSAKIVATSVRTWRIESGDIRLSTTLERWTKEAGYNLIWDAQKQVLLSAKDSFDGTLEEALARVLRSPAIARSDYPLEACFYPNQPPVVRVTRKGDQAEECPL